MVNRPVGREQIGTIVEQAEMEMPVAELNRRVGISEQTFYRWKRHYSNLEVDQARQLKQLQDENGRLKKLVAELTVDRAMLQDCREKTGETLTAPPSGSLPVQRVGCKRAEGLSRGGDSDLDAPTPEPKSSTDRAEDTNAEAGQRADTIRLTARSGFC